MRSFVEGMSDNLNDRNAVDLGSSAVHLLSLDPATHCGWAVGSFSVTSGTWDCSVKKGEASGLRLFRFRGFLDSLQASVPIQRIVYEGAIQMPGNRSGGSVQAEMQGVLKLWCVDHGISCQSYSPGQIKKFATGKGNATKEQRVDAAERKWRRIFQDKAHDEVDARWLWLLAKSEEGA